MYQVGSGLTCATCRESQGEKSHNVSKATKDLQFNDLVCVDTFEVELTHKKMKFLDIVDIGTRYQLCAPLWKGIGAQVIQEVGNVGQVLPDSWSVMVDRSLEQRGQITLPMMAQNTL